MNNSNNEEQARWKLIVGKILSQLLNVPILSGAMLTYFYIKLPVDIPNRTTGFIWALIFMSLIPMTSLFFYIPGKTKEWAAVVKRQRNISFIFMIISYPIGYIVLHLTGVPKIFEAIAVTYTLVTVGLIIFNLIIRYKASGHAAGVAGPIGAMIYLYGLIASPLLALLPLVTWARVRAKGHNTMQTVVGAALSFSITLVVLLIYGFAPFRGLVY